MRRGNKRLTLHKTVCWNGVPRTCTYDCSQSIIIIWNSGPTATKLGESWRETLKRHYPSWWRGKIWEMWHIWQNAKIVKLEGVEPAHNSYHPRRLTIQPSRPWKQQLHFNSYTNFHFCCIFARFSLETLSAYYSAHKAIQEKRKTVRCLQFQGLSIDIGLVQKSGIKSAAFPS